MTSFSLKKIFILFFILALIPLTGCGKRSALSDKNIETTAETDATEDDTIPGKVNYKIQYVKFDFVSAEEKNTWREPLVRILSQMHPGGYYIETNPEASDPDLRYTFIPGGYAITLLDINVDGVPEVLEAYPGGSAGNTFYKVYDLNTGEVIGNLDGSGNNDWCIYFDSRTGKLEIIGQYSWREGWTGRVRFITKARLAHAEGNSNTVVYEEPYLCVKYVIDIIAHELTEKEKAAGISAAFDEIYPETFYYVNGNESYYDAYYKEYDRFIENCVRIPETAVRLFAWNDVSSDDDDQNIRASLMADALISSEQEFIILQVECLK